METWLLIVILFIVGDLCLAVYTWLLYNSAKSLRDHHEEVTARITKINPHNYLMTSAYKIDVEYDVNGETFRGRVVASRAEVNALKIADEPGMKIIYDTEIPANCGNANINPMRRVRELALAFVVFIGVILLIFGKNYGWWG